MGTVSFEVPGPGTYQVQCDPKLDPLPGGGTAADILAGKQFYNPDNSPVTGTMPNNPPQQVSVAGGESYTIPQGYHDGTGEVTGTGTVLPTLTNPGTAGDLLKDKELIDQSGNVVTGTLEPGTDTSDATATAGDILAPKTAYVAAGKVTGTIATKSESDVTADGPTVAVPPGYYPQAVNKTVSDSNLLPDNIKQGVEIFGVTGTFAGGLPEGVRTITLTADPPEGGTVSGGGMAQDGMTVTVNAEANEADDYSFDGWRENDTVVSEEPLYTFPVTVTRTLIATFLQFKYTAGVDWWETTLPSSANWRSVAYGNGKFVAVAYESNKAVYSYDGVNWEEATLPSTANWKSITYGDGKFVAIGYNSNKAAYSTDGISWTASTLPSSQLWNSVAHGDGKFAAVSGSAKAIAYSTDGINWKQVIITPVLELRGVAYGDGKFVAVANKASQAIYSTDGITWQTATLPSYIQLNSVTYGDGKFVATGESGTKVVYSYDGITWKSTEIYNNSETHRTNIAYGDNKFVSLGYNVLLCFLSTDGITWTTANLPNTRYWHSVAYGDGKFVGVGSSSDKAAYSSAKGPGV